MAKKCWVYYIFSLLEAWIILVTVFSSLELFSVPKLNPNASVWIPSFYFSVFFIYADFVFLNAKLKASGLAGK